MSASTIASNIAPHVNLAFWLFASCSCNLYDLLPLTCCWLLFCLWSSWTAVIGWLIIEGFFVPARHRLCCQNHIHRIKIYSFMDHPIPMVPYCPQSCKNSLQVVHRVCFSFFFNIYWEEKPVIVGLLCCWNQMSEGLKLYHASKLLWKDKTEIDVW